MRAAILSQPRRARGPRWLTLLGWALLAAAAMFTLLTLYGGPHHAIGRPGAVTRWVLLGVVALAVVVTWWSLPRRSMLPPASWKLLTIALAVPLLVGLWLVTWHSQYQDPYWRAGWACFRLTLLSAPGPFLALFMAGPRFAPTNPRLAGAALGAVSGAWAAIVVELWCPLALPAHVAFGHVAPLFALVVLGALVGGRVLRPRARLAASGHS